MTAAKLEKHAKRMYDLINVIERMRRSLIADGLEREASALLGARGAAMETWGLMDDAIHVVSCPSHSEAERLTAGGAS